MPEVRVSLGTTVFVKERGGNGLATIREAKVKEKQGKGLAVIFPGRERNTRFVPWSHLGPSASGPFGMHAFMPSRTLPGLPTGEPFNPVRLPIQNVEALPFKTGKGHSSLEKLAEKVLGYQIELDGHGGAYVLVTPDLACRILERSREKNIRKVNQTRVKRYIHPMLAGKWSPRAGNPVGIDLEGYLMNGQHRMWAIVESDTAIELYIIFGTTEEEKKYATDVPNTSRSLPLSLEEDRIYITLVNNVRKYSTGHKKMEALGNDEMHEWINYYREHLQWLENIPTRAKGQKAKHLHTDVQAVIMRARENGEQEDLLVAFIQKFRRDPLTVNVVLSQDQLDLIDAFAQFIGSRGTSGEPLRIERSAKAEYVLQHFLKNERAPRILKNTQAIWPSKMPKTLPLAKENQASRSPSDGTSR